MSRGPRKPANKTSTKPTFPREPFKIFLGNPTDAAEAVEKVKEAIKTVSRKHSVRWGFELEPVHWKTHARPASGDRPQALLMRQCVEDCDMMIAVFHARVGSPSGKADTESGTTEEIELFLDAKKPVSMYTFEGMIHTSKIDAAQWEKLTGFKNRIRNRVLYWTYPDPQRLSQLVREHLLKDIDDVAAKRRNEALRTLAASNTTTRPDSLGRGPLDRVLDYTVRLGWDPSQKLSDHAGLGSLIERRADLAAATSLGSLLGVDQQESAAAHARAEELESRPHRASRPEDLALDYLRAARRKKPL